MRPQHKESDNNKRKETTAQGMSSRQKKRDHSTRKKTTIHGMEPQVKEGVHNTRKDTIAQGGSPQHKYPWRCSCLSFGAFCPFIVLPGSTITSLGLSW